MNMMPLWLRTWVRKELGPGYRKLRRCLNTVLKHFIVKKAVNSNSAQAYLKLGNICYRLSQLNEAIEHYEKAIELDPSLFEAYSRLILMHRLNGQEAKQDRKGNKIYDERTFNLDKASLDRTLACCERMVSAFPDSPEANFKMGNALIMAKADRHEGMRFIYQSVKLKLRKIRSNGNIGIIFVASLPRSGTGYLKRSLEKGFKISKKHSGGINNTSWWFPNDVISPPEYTIYNRPIPNQIVSCHLSASEQNLVALNMAVDRLVVNVRDPRQALLSWVHYMDYFRFTNNIEGLLEGCIPKNYFELSLTDQISWQIEHYYFPIALKWIEGWLDAEADPLFCPEILFTRHEDLVVNPQGYFESILDFYGIDKQRFIFPNKPEFKKNTHMRKGSVDEWKEVFTSDQARKATSMIPERLLTKFSWSKDAATSVKGESFA